MSGSIKGIIVEIGGDTSGLQKALSKVNSATSSLSKELKQVNSLLKLDPKNSELLKQKQDILNSSISTTQDKLKQLQKIKEEADKKMADGTEINAENYRALQREIIKTQTKLSDLKNENSGWNKAGNYLTNLGKELDTISSKVDSLGNKLTTRLTLPVVAGFTVMTKSAIENETAMQQVEKIYGKAADSIKDFAENKAIDYNMSASEAYKYSQIYGNLIQSITDDQTENAEKTQELLQASSVIASSTGRSMEDVMDRIRSGLLGNTEAIEDLGVNVNVALLETTDAFKQIAGDKSWDKLTFQEQQQIRLLGILEQTSKKYGKEVNKNTASSIQQLTAKTKNLTNNLGKKLLPVANKLLDKANSLMDKFENLNDEEQENIIKIGLMVAAAGPLLKVGSKAITIVGGVTKGIGTFTKAIGLAHNGIGTATGSAATLAKVLQGLASPAGIAAGVIGGISIAIAAATEEERRYAKECENLKEKVLEEKQAIDELRTSIDIKMQSDLKETENTKILWQELQKITDENGKIKEGYETRAKVIANELSQALGIEISTTDNVIDKYRELQNEIDTLILKKQAEIVLNANEEKYTEAIKNRTQKTQELLDLEEQLNEARKKERELAEKWDRDATIVDFLTLGIPAEIGTDKWREAQKAVENLETAYNETKLAVEQYSADISNYNYNAALVAEGSSESLNKVINSVGETYIKNGQTVKTTYEEQIKEQQKYNKIYKMLQDEAIKNNDEAERQKNETQINATNIRLENLAKELKGQVSATEAMSPDIANAWKALAEDSYDIYAETIKDLPYSTQQKIQEMTNVVVVETPTWKEVWKKLGEEGIESLDKDEEFRQQALNSMESFLLGLEDETLRETLKRASVENIDTVMEAIKNGDLSEEKGIEVLKGLWKGLGNQSWQNNLYNRANSLSSKLSNTFSGNYNRYLPGHKNGLDYVPYDNYIARLHKGERVLTAEENKHLIDMEKASRLNKKASLLNDQIKLLDRQKMIFTTPNITFNVQKMDEANLNSAFNYINRRLGSQY